MTKKILFLLTFLLTTLGGGQLWAEDYKPTTTHTFTTTQDIIVTENNPVLVAGKTDGWIKIPSEGYGSTIPVPDSEMDTPTTSVSCLRTKKADNFTSQSRVIHFRVTGITGVKAIGNVNGHESFGIGATEYSSSVTEINKVVTSGGNVVSHTGLDKSKTYIISIFSFTNDDQYLYAVRFYSDPYETNIGIGDLCYAVGTGGKNANSNGLDRAVGGFNLTFGGGDGIKYNGGNQLTARYNTGTITIALDDNNSKKNITKVVMTRSAAGTGKFTASDNYEVTNSGTTITWQGTACKTITFTQTGESVNITNIAITTDVAPTFEKVTPTVTINPASASVKKATAGTFTTTATSSPNNFNWTWTPSSLANVTYYTKSEGNADAMGEPGTFKTTAESTTTGDNTLVASFAGNDFFKAVNNAATYTLTINEPVASTPDETVHPYPYTWNFANGSSTWGSSSTQLPISDWNKGGETYYNYNVPNSKTGFNIDAIKGLRFQNIGYLGLDWGYGHIWSTAGTITIPNVPFGMTIQIVAQNRNDSNPATTITPTNATYTGEGTATLGTEYTTYTFTSTATGTDVSFVFSGKSSIKSIAVLKTAIPHKWDFETSTYWSTTRGDLNASYWVESSDVANNPDEVMSNVAFSGEELTKDGTNKIPEMEGLVMTAVKGSSRFKIGKYYRLGNYSKARITIPSMTTGQTVTFKVETATSGMERGITATSSNLELISGQVSDKVSYYTFRVTSDGDGEFRQTSEDAGLKIYYIDLKAATTAATELKFVDGNNNDISNKQVNIKSGSVTGALDSYFTLAQGGSGANVTVTVSPSGLITYDNDGTFTMGSGTGTATITARTESSSVETGIAVLYVSVKNQPTVKLNHTQDPPYSVNYGQDFNGGTSTVTGTSSASLTVKYKSSNERVATVNASGHVTCVGVGTATITAYTEETETYLPAEASYQVTYNAGNVVFQFEPSEVKLALGRDITPYLHYDQAGQLDPETLDFTMSKSDIVTCDVVTDAKQHDKKVIKITSVDDASKIGETVIVTASAQMRNSSVVYYTTIAVTITAADAVNFGWVNGDDIYVYENTYFPIPGYTGNASGNNHFSNGTLNKDTYKAYLYKRDGGGAPVWNKENYKLNQGVPDYYVDDTGKAFIFWAKSDKTTEYPDTLLVYAKSAGTVTLHAKDSQTDAECTPITIHILAKSGLENAHTAEVSTISFPYTWDFTKDFSENDFTNSMFWKSTGSGRYDNTAVWMNDDWANESGGGKFDVNFLGGTGAGSPIALFKGAQIQLGNSTYNSKIGRIQVKPNAEDGNSHLTIIGGQHYLYLPEIPVSRTPNQAYRLYVKAKGQTTTYDNGIRKDEDCSRIIVEVDKGSGGYDRLGMLLYAEETVGKKDYIEKCLYCDIPAASAGKKLRLNFDKNVELYWIALSTEEKLVTRQSNTTYHAATYSYGQDLDIVKSQEANKDVTAYYTTSFSNGKTLAMTPITDCQNTVPSGTGIMLKANKGESFDNVSSYMVASARNTDNYITPSSLSGNLLVATPSTGTVDSQETIENKTYTNFLLSYRYKTYDWEDGSTVNNNFTNAPDWVFYRIKPGGIATASNMAYLHVEGNMFVDANGNIVNLSRRNSASEETDNQDGPIAPASQNMLKIIFLDEDPIEDSGTTDISTVNERTIDTDAWYTLQGVRVNAPAKGGIYIHKGKKVVVK